MSRKTLFGTVGFRRAAGLRPIGTVGGRDVFPIRGAESDDDLDDADDKGAGADKGAAGKGKSGKDGDDDSDDDDDDLDAATSTGDKDKDRAIRQAIARKQLLKASDAKVAELEEQLRQAGLKDASDLEKTQSDLKAMTAKYDKLFAKTKETSMTNAALMASPKLKLEWRDNEDVINWLEKQEDVSVGDDGTVEGVEAALKKLAKAKPHWLKTDDGKGSGNDGQQSGGNVGGSGGGSGDKAKTNRTALEKKYPALIRNRS